MELQNHHYDRKYDARRNPYSTLIKVTNALFPITISHIEYFEPYRA